MSAIGGKAESDVRSHEARRIAAARQQIFWKRARRRGMLTGVST
jgi:hypothetical protein